MIVPSVRWLARLSLALLALFFSSSFPALAQQRLEAVLIAEQPKPQPGSSTTIAIDIRPATGWHGYWLNPGDAGTPPRIDWTLPPGATLAPLRYPVPQRLVISGLMNHVYESEHALLARLDIAPDVKPGTRLPIRASAHWLVCSDTLCVPEQAELSLDLVAGSGAATSAIDPRFDRWRAALPRPLGAKARFEIKGELVRIAIPYPATALLETPHFFAETRDVVDYAKPQFWGRAGDTLIAEIPKAQFFTASPTLKAVLATGPDQGLEIEAIPGTVPAMAAPLTDGGASTGGRDSPITLWLALGGAILGGLLLNLMPCVFPILSLKAMSLIRAGASASEGRREGLAYMTGAVAGTTALGGLLLLLRASGEQAGWAFQLQYPATILVLYALMALMTANLAGWVSLPAINAGQSLTQRQGIFGALFTGALAAFVATPCTGPFLGAAMGAALVLPPASALAVFAGLGLGIALPFVAIGFIPALRTRLPRPGGWMERVKHWLAVPMGLTAMALLWLLWRQAGMAGLLAALTVTLFAALLLWRRQGRAGSVPLALGFAASLALGIALPMTSTDTGSPATSNTSTMPFSATKLAGLRQAGTPLLLYFTADWCITCKVNEAAAIDRAEVQDHFRVKGIKTMIGDWTRGDPAITRFLESQGRSGVPLYLFYPAGGGEPVTLPQLLTPDTLLALG